MSVLHVLHLQGGTKPEVPSFVFNRRKFFLNS